MKESEIVTLQLSSRQEGEEEKTIDIEPNQINHEDKKNSPLFIFILGLSYNITRQFLLVIGVRMINIVVNRSENPSPESRKWLSICTIVGLLTCLIVSKPVGLLCDIVGRRFTFLFCFASWFLALATSCLSLFCLRPQLLVVYGFFNGIGLCNFWIPKLILKDILPNEDISIWFTYTFVAQCVSQAVISISVGFLVHPQYGKMDLLYIALISCLIALIFLLSMFFYLIETKSKLKKNYTWRDYVFIFDIKEIMKHDNVGILFTVLFCTFWGQIVWGFDKDNFVNTHFKWTILQFSILISSAAMASLIIHPWGLTVNYFSDTFVVKGAMISKTLGYVLFAFSPMIHEFTAYIASLFEAIGGVAEPILISLLSKRTDGNVAVKFGALYTLRGLAGIITSACLMGYRHKLQEDAKISIMPALHFLISAGFIFIGTILFSFYFKETPAHHSNGEDNDSFTESISNIETKTCTNL